MHQTGKTVVILGAGISGLVAAKVLADQGWRVTLLEPAAMAGGNQRSRTIGDFTFDIGSFIFFDDGAFFRLFPEAGRTCQPVAIAATRITPTGRIHAYPISIRDDVLRQPITAMLLDLASLLYARIVSHRPVSAGSFARYYLGRRLFVRTGLSNYITRMFGIAADDIDYAFAEKRMAWIARSARISSLTDRLVPKRRAASRPAARPVVRPRAGFEGLFATAIAQLRDAGVDVRFDVALAAIDGSIGAMAVHTDGDTLTADRVVSTLPLNLTAGLCGVAPSPTLQSVTLLTLYVSFKGELGFTSGILCNFSNDGAWKRLTVHSRVYGQVDGYDYLGVEVPLTSGDADAQAAFEDFAVHMRRSRLLDGDALLVGHDVTPGAYPIYRRGASDESRRLIEEIEARGVDLIGRQGRFDYLPTSSAAAKEARHFAAAIAGADPAGGTPAAS